MNKIKRKLTYFLQEIRSSYWFIPGVLVSFSFLLAIFSIELDRSAPNELMDKLSWLFTDDAEAASTILSTIASVTMGVAGVTFSMTLLSISFASSQIGPRIFSGFMRDRGNQVSLGVFIATFVYCLMVLRTIYSPSEGEGFVPNLSIVFALIFALLSISVLIYFINHIPTLMSMTNSINRTAGELISSIKLQFPINLGEEGNFNENVMLKKINPIEVKARGMGYIEYINYEILIETCDQNNLLVEIVKKPGDFVSREITVAYIYCPDKVEDDLKQKISDIFIEGVNRSYEQDILFPGNLLVEIAARALSPGVNDPYTAIDCMNRLQTALLFMQEREAPSKYRIGSDNKVRVISEPILYEEFFNHILNSLRSYVKMDFLCTKHLLKTIKVLSMNDKKEQLPIYVKQSNQLAKSFIDNTKDEMDINEIKSLILE